MGVLRLITNGPLSWIYILKDEVEIALVCFLMEWLSGCTAPVDVGGF